MIALNQFTVKTTKNSEEEVTFEVSPLPKGYGHTFGNMMRRVLLSSIFGSSISAAKIDGVTHEYSSLEGMKDDVLTVLLSMKNIIVKSNTEDDVELEIDVTCEGDIREVTAGDIKKNNLVEIVNPDYVITTLTNKGAKFKSTLIVSKGVGYQMPNHDLRKELGMIPLDPIFTPVKLVRFDVSPTRVGQQTDLDQLNLTIKTDGSVSAEEAFHIASNILLQMSNHMFANAEKVLSGDAPELLSSQTISEEDIEWGGRTENKSDNSRHELPIVDLNLSTRLTNALLRSGYDDLNMLEGMTEEDLGNIRGMGTKSLEELIEIMNKHGVKII